MSSVDVDIDTAKGEAFAERMMGLLNDGFLGFLVSIGHRTGLFDTLAEIGPAQSEAVATSARLHERYVREWLGAMVLGRIVEFEPEERTYSLPAEHGAFLTRAAGSDNLAFFTQYLRMLGAVESDVVSCFHNGGGVGYDCYPEFQQLQAEESARFFDEALASVVLPLAPGLVERLRSGIDVVDLGTGQGHAVNLMAREFPKSRFLGLDFAEDAIAVGRAEAEQWGLTNARFEAVDVTKPISGRFDLATAFDVVHDLSDAQGTLSHIAKALRPGGVFLMMDMAGSSHLEENMDHPVGPLLYTASVMHCMTVSLAQHGEGLGTMWGEETAQNYLARAGFTDIEVHHLECDPMHAFYVTRAPSS